jgi:hypothetical protein
MMKKNWPAGISIIASMMLAITILWPEPDTDRNPPDPQDTTMGQKSREKVTTDDRIAKIPPLRTAILPPPPRQTNADKNQPDNFQSSVLEVTPVKPIETTNGVSPLKRIETIKPSQKTPKSPLSLLKPLQKFDRTQQKEKLITLRPLKPLKKMETRRSLPPQNTTVTSIIKEKTRPTAEKHLQKSSNMSTTVTDTSSQSLRKGRALLRILEHGSGPEINFAWPENHAARNNLFDIFRRCYGMHVALLGSNNFLYRLTDPAGKPWKPNMDKISGFSRIVGGKIAESEEKLIYRLKRRHSSIRGGTPVRLFPRNFDGAVLGGLSKFIGMVDAPLRSISARYKMNGSRVLMTDIRINRSPVSGVIDLGSYSSCKKFRRTA